MMLSILPTYSVILSTALISEFKKLATCLLKNYVICYNPILAIVINSPADSKQLVAVYMYDEC